MNKDAGEHDNRDFANGRTVHLVRHPDQDWQIASYDWSFVRDQVLYNPRVFAQEIGWGNEYFGTRDEAYEFVQTQFDTCTAPNTVEQVIALKQKIA